ncbi:MAG: hypothetical protein ABIN96_15445 [Rubrivivax sp.]
MLIPRKLNRFIARLLVGVMVLAQLSVAAYACDGGQRMLTSSAVASGADVPSLRVAMTDLADGNLGDTRMDPTQPNRCAAHCQSGQQHADGKPAPSVPAVVPKSLYPRAVTVLSADIQRASTAPDDPPPGADRSHAILHCCFRI